jgi:fatty acid desaturase
MSSAPISWYRTPIDKEKLRELTRKSDWKGLAHAGGFLTIYVGSLVLNTWLFLEQAWIPLIIGCYIHSVFASFMGIEAAVHELSHGTVFESKWLNSLFYRLFAFLTWNSFVHFKESHTKHHLSTYYRNLDREQQSDPISVRWYDVLSWFTFDYKKFRKHVWTNINHALGNTDVDFFFWCPLLPKESIKTRKLVGWARTMIIGHLLLIVLFIWLELWVLIYLVTFGTFFATFLSHATGIMQHAGQPGNVPDWRLNSHVVKLGPVMSFLYWQMHYHTDHHMYASVPFYNLPRLHREIEWDLQKPFPGLISGLHHVASVRKMQENDPEYRYIPEFPESATPPPA